MTETTALGAAIAAGAADGIGLWDTKTKKESSDVTIFQPKLDESGKRAGIVQFIFLPLFARVYITSAHFAQLVFFWSSYSAIIMNALSLPSF